MKRPTPPYRSLIENPRWVKQKCERCEVDFWLEPCKVGTILFCTKTCRYEDPLVVIEKRTTKDGHPKGCWECSLTPSSDYPCLKTKGEQLRATRLVLEAALGRPIAPGMLALHQCDNPRCVRVGPEHIFEGTQSQNIEGCVERGRHMAPFGELHSNSDLTELQVVEIKKLKGAQSLEDTAKQFGVKSNTTIWNIWNGKTWKHVDAAPPT